MHQTRNTNPRLDKANSRVHWINFDAVPKAEGDIPTEPSSPTEPAPQLRYPGELAAQLTVLARNDTLRGSASPAPTLSDYSEETFGSRASTPVPTMPRLLSPPSETYRLLPTYTEIYRLRPARDLWETRSTRGAFLDELKKVRIMADTLVYHTDAERTKTVLLIEELLTMYGTEE